MDMQVKGVLGEIYFDGEWITIRKKAPGQRAQEFRLRAADVTGTRHKPASRLFHGYVQFVLPGSQPAPEKTTSGTAADHRTTTHTACPSATAATRRPRN
ncbi:hypothetical protein C9F11_38455 [Streptomyces sp. YIM 121038]|uniref:hypothetical protein n=1 Tax=Streptomyces sp. YIM 121038 TaxID=2136401 RepID=UPI001110174D|nr:hypothetical protein [Streptomyces sp. YIM 121038]QCX81274.1 hypothetical protein C9F11_38455 [Streptomyces sp. YIM 121038]